MSTPTKDQMKNLSVKTLQTISVAHDHIEWLVHSGVHEDVIEYMLGPLEAVLKANGVNLPI